MARPDSPSIIIDDGKLRFLVSGGTSGLQTGDITTTDSYDDGIWHHVVVTWDAIGVTDGVKIYVDGVEKAKANTTAVIFLRKSAIFEVSVKNSALFLSPVGNVEAKRR